MTSVGSDKACRARRRNLAPLRSCTQREPRSACRPSLSESQLKAGSPERPVQSVGWPPEVLTGAGGRCRRSAVTPAVTADNPSLSGRTRRQPAVSAPPVPGTVPAYIEARFKDDPRVEASVLHGELGGAAFDGPIRRLMPGAAALELRLICVVCQHRSGRAVTVELRFPSRATDHGSDLGSPENDQASPALRLRDGGRNAGNRRARAAHPLDCQPPRGALSSLPHFCRTTQGLVRPHGFSNITFCRHSLGEPGRPPSPSSEVPRTDIPERSLSFFAAA